MTDAEKKNPDDQPVPAGDSAAKPLAAPDTPTSANNLSQENTSEETRNKTTDNADDLPPEVRRAIAQVQVSMLGRQGDAKNKSSSRRNRNMIAISFVFMALFAFGLWGFIYEPAATEYQPLPDNGQTPLTALPGQFGITLSAAWTAQTPNVFIHTSGARLTVLYGHVKYFDVSPRLPKALGGTGRPVYTQYTTTAYRNNLPKRVADIAGEVTAWKIKYAKQHGLEATAVLKNGQLFRSFLIIQTVNKSGYIKQPFRILEMRFRLPCKKGDALWQEAERIFCSLRNFVPPPPTSISKEKR